MLDSISWQEFFTTVALLIGGYYFITLLLLYGSDITSTFKQKKLDDPGGEIQASHNDSNESNGLMGGVHFENRNEQNVPLEEITSAEEIQTVLSQEDEDPVNAVDPAVENLKNDFINIKREINSLVEIVSQGSKEESIPLFRILLFNYPQLINSVYQEQVTQFIHDACKRTCQFHFDLNEINSWWTESKVTPSDNQQTTTK